MTARQPPRKSQAGFTLIEVLVSILLFSFGILGMVGLLARATQFSVDAEDRNRAALLANEIAAAMWTAGAVEKLSDREISDWQARVNNPQVGGLFKGEGQVERTATGSGAVANIIVTWEHPGRKADDPSRRSRYATQVVIQ